MLVFLRKTGYGKESVGNIISQMSVEAQETTNPRRISPTDVVIRWGNLVPVTCAREINSRNAGLISSNKLNARRECGVPTPRSFGCWENIPGDFNFPGIVRPLHHTQGRDILVVNCREEIPVSRGHYVAELLQKTREFRIFVAGSGVFAVAEKIPQDRNAVAWNHAAGAEFISVRSGWPILPCTMAIQATYNFGLDFSAVDIIETADGYFFIEANTAFSLASSYRVQRLARYFSLCGEETFHQKIIDGAKKYSQVVLNLGGQDE